MLMCRDLARMASDYIDGELTASQKLSVRMHLLMCVHCRTFIGNLRASTKLMQAHSSVDPSPELVRKIEDRIAQALAKPAQPDDDRE